MKCPEIINLNLYFCYVMAKKLFTPAKRVYQETFERKKNGKIARLMYQSNESLVIKFFKLLLNESFI